MTRVGTRLSDCNLSETVCSRPEGERQETLRSRHLAAQDFRSPTCLLRESGRLAQSGLLVQREGGTASAGVVLTATSGARAASSGSVVEAAARQADDLKRRGLQYRLGMLKIEDAKTSTTDAA